jgi:hypothetical protein
VQYIGKVFIVNVVVTSIAPNGQISVGEGQRMLGLVVVVHHMLIDIPTAMDLIAAQADPVLPNMCTLLTRYDNIQSSLWYGFQPSVNVVAVPLGCYSKHGVL